MKVYTNSKVNITLISGLDTTKNRLIKNYFQNEILGLSN